MKSLLESSDTFSDPSFIFLVSDRPQSLPALSVRARLGGVIPHMFLGIDCA